MMHRSSTYLAAEFTQRSVSHDLPTSVRIANWAYQQAFDARGLAWTRQGDMVGLPSDWRGLLAQLLASSE